MMSIKIKKVFLLHNLNHRSFTSTYSNLRTPNKINKIVKTNELLKRNVQRKLTILASEGIMSQIYSLSFFFFFDNYKVPTLVIFFF
jgi:hypothetical protein